MHGGKHGRHGGLHAHDGAHLVVGAVAPLAPLLVRDGLMQGEEQDAVLLLERLLGLERVDGLLEERSRHDGAGGARHLLDARRHPLGQLRLLRDGLQGLQVREGLDTVVPVDGEALHGRGALHLLDEPARDVGALLEHGALDAGDESHGQPPRRPLALLDEEVGLALDGEDGRDPEAHDEDDHDEHGDLDGEGGGGQLHGRARFKSGPRGRPSRARGARA